MYYTQYYYKNYLTSTITWANLPTSLAAICGYPNLIVLVVTWLLRPAQYFQQEFVRTCCLNPCFFWKWGFFETPKFKDFSYTGQAEKPFLRLAYIQHNATVLTSISSQFYWNLPVINLLSISHSVGIRD